jgi:hypothetical protein
MQVLYLLQENCVGKKSEKHLREPLDLNKRSVRFLFFLHPSRTVSSYVAWNGRLQFLLGRGDLVFFRGGERERSLAFFRPWQRNKQDGPKGIFFFS